METLFLDFQQEIYNEFKDKFKEFEENLLEKDEEIVGLKRKNQTYEREVLDSQQKILLLQGENAEMGERLRELSARYAALKNTASQLEAFRKAMISLIQSGPPPLSSHADMLRSANNSFSVLDEARSLSASSLTRPFSHSMMEGRASYEAGEHRSGLPLSLGTVKTYSMSKSAGTSVPKHSPDLDTVSESTAKGPHLAHSKGLTAASPFGAETTSDAPPLLYQAKAFESSAKSSTDEPALQQPELASHPQYAAQSAADPPFPQQDEYAFLEQHEPAPLEELEKTDDLVNHSKLAVDGSFAETQE
ncbi:hypothetical protein HDU91_000567, partial [Kappamyces sp. JEL0680]